ncbi:PH domain-containing protein [Actinokineospora terrae]|uniref:PH domain-containing protein n=1 Tax=Actinokineospora terrae TaxID=155974 RepID=UPI001160AB9A|nr:PH domain-containing protein [Actinokineospora terrae]
MSEQQQVPSRLVFRVPGIAVLAALLFAICATPFAFAAPGLVAVYVIPIALVVWVLRVRTTADAEGLVVREVVSSRPLPWKLLKGLRLNAAGRVSAVLHDDTEVALPQVRTRHLPALALVSGGRLADPTEGGPEGEPDDEALVEAPAESPAEPQAESAVESAVDAPAEDLVEPPAASPVESPADSPVAPPAESAAEAPVEPGSGAGAAEVTEEAGHRTGTRE